MLRLHIISFGFTKSTKVLGKEKFGDIFSSFFSKHKGKWKRREHNFLFLLLKRQLILSFQGNLLSLSRDILLKQETIPNLPFHQRKKNFQIYFQ